MTDLSRSTATPTLAGRLINFKAPKISTNIRLEQKESKYSGEAKAVASALKGESCKLQQKGESLRV
jgi:hypothetical protein